MLTVVWIISISDIWNKAVLCIFYVHFG